MQLLRPTCAEETAWKQHKPTINISVYWCSVQILKEHEMYIHGAIVDSAICVQK